MRVVFHGGPKDGQEVSVNIGTRRIEFCGANPGGKFVVLEYVNMGVKDDRGRLIYEFDGWRGDNKSRKAEFRG